MRRMYGAAALGLAIGMVMAPAPATPDGLVVVRMVLAVIGFNVWMRIEKKEP